MKRIVLALAVASSMSLSVSQADAGPLTDKIKSGLRDVGGLGIVVASCIKQKLSGQPAFFCPR